MEKRSGTDFPRVANESHCSCLLDLFTDSDTLFPKKDSHIETLIWD